MRTISKLFVKPGLVILVLFLMTAVLGASEYAYFSLRLYNGVKTGQAAKSVVTTSYIEPYFVGETVSESALLEEQEKLKRVFNVNEVRLLVDTALLYRYKPNTKLFRLIRKNGNSIGALLSKVKGKDTYRIKVSEGKDYNDKSKNLLDTEAVLPVKNTVVFGFKDLKGETYYMPFHGHPLLRQAALMAVKESKYKASPTELPFSVIVSFRLPKAGEGKQTFGDLIGTVTMGKDGTVLAGVTVKATGKEGGEARTTKTDQNGFYGFMGLPSGSYTVRYSHEGYMTVLRKTYLQGGKTYKLNVYLKKK